MLDSVKTFIQSLSTPTGPTTVPTKQWDVSPQNFSLKGPIPVDPSQEEKWICRCGQSKNYPYCDGSHNNYNKENDTNIVPLKVEKGSEKVYVCTCGHSKDKPFCDGTHSKLRLIQEQKNSNNVDLGNFTRFLVPVVAYVAFTSALKHLSQ
ncbi:hypothetical protein DLAC_04081 [Tieghemostelium lacteum]|uniref:Iron-binding zinc finger CDGSH type domain-containing protein n=1 Tax=Tieghemostelium lacteum TaxID=361077 RepID=A0A151ZS72_TIELA|nr:hypothetical protein DLAC_04081 [Tieghemostelium lacteum]|eukprot:KYQ96782.1 hypothetical protein DLAC_04081 [Tieghemostelium lacteum]